MTIDEALYLTPGTVLRRRKNGEWLVLEAVEPASRTVRCRRRDGEEIRLNVESVERAQRIRRFGPPPRRMSYGRVARG